MRCYVVEGIIAAPFVSSPGLLREETLDLGLPKRMMATCGVVLPAGGIVFGADVVYRWLCGRVAYLFPRQQWWVSVTWSHGVSTEDAG
jgi:hypothetical protein